jgi:site-specific recombinase XerD
MFENVLTDPRAIGRYGRKAFAPQVHAYLNRLEEMGYSGSTVQRRLFLLSCFNDYLSKRGVTYVEEMPVHVSAFVRYWTRRSQRLGRTKNPQRLAGEVDCYVHLFLRFLAATGELDLPAHPGSRLEPASEEILADFLGHLRTERGLAEPTISLYELYVRRFLRHTAAAGVVQPSEWSRQILFAHLKQEGIGTGRKGMNGVCSALRSLFRFLRMESHPLQEGLKTFPRPRIYRQESQPRFLHAEQVQRVLQSVDRSTKQGMRDYAILMLLVTYGIRAAEVARLRLDDLDWAGGKIHFRNRKNRSGAIFPLSGPTAESLVEYLQRARPRACFREFFLSVRAPIRPFRSGSTVSMIARKRLLASGIACSYRPGAHVFRHSCAHRLLSLGLPYKTVGDFLGHTSVSSTSAYLKMDIQELRQVAENDGEDLL